MAYSIDSAVFHFGTALKNELEGVEGKSAQEINNKRDMILREWLGMPKRFRNPVMVGSGTDSDVEETFVVRGQY